MNGDLDELGLPRHISEPERDVTGADPSGDITVNLTEYAEVDSVRIIFRCGSAIVLKELWQNGMIVCSIQTSKGQGQFAVYDPNNTGHNGMKVSVPTHVL
jgi:hypothetical protein